MVWEFQEGILFFCSDTRGDFKKYMENGLKEVSFGLESFQDPYWSAFQYDNKTPNIG